MKKNLIILLSLLYIVACGDKPTRTQAFAFKNSTSHSIKIIPYKDGNIISARVLEVKPHSTLGIDTISVAADSGTPPEFPGFFNGLDSVRVHFDNEKLITHLLLSGYNSVNNNYKPDSPRNFNNAKSAIIIKSDWVWEITYTFTEQDYLDAKQ